MRTSSDWMRVVSGDALTSEGVEEVEARLSLTDEAAPLFHHHNARLVHAPIEQEEGVHHPPRLRLQ
jgi:hypothetical protein